MTILRSLFLSGILVLPAAQLSAATTLLAGFHDFSDNQTLFNFIKPQADEGLFSANSSLTSSRGFGVTGGSYDGFYGPDATSDAVQTNQTAASTQGYEFEDASDSAGRLQPSYAATAPNPSQEGTHFNGRVLAINGVDVNVTNTSGVDYVLDRFVFDAFLGDTSGMNPSFEFTDFTITVRDQNGVPSSQERSITEGYSGFHNQNGDGLNASLAPALPGDNFEVNNLVDYGVGTNYQDYAVALSGIVLESGGSLTIRFNSTGQNAIVRGDNFGLFGSQFSPVPEPSSALALGSLLCGAFFVRRRS